MKKTLLALALAAACLPALAQVAVDAQSQSNGTAQVGDIGITTVMNMPGAPALSETNVNYGGSYRVKGVPVNSAASSFASQPAWRCTGAGNGGALQLKDFAFSLALGGNDKNICSLEFRMAVTTLITEQFVAKSPSYAANHALACEDTLIADALEKTEQMKCDEPQPEARKARWEREREAKRQAAIAQGKPIPVTYARLPTAAGAQGIWMP